MQRLSQRAALPAQVVARAYEPEAHGIGIVHFGIGAFHRAHMAVYTEDALASQGGNWRISGISLRSPDVRDRLLPQDCRYTLVERGGGGEKRRVIGSVAEVLVARENPAAVFERLCDAEVQIFSLTITEKGYLRDPANGALLTRHPDIQHDLSHPGTPRTMHGFITEALARRRRLGLPAVTLLCCDNLPHNGRSLQRVICEFARLRDAELADWIAQAVACPATMVDRIVPATTRDDIERTDRALGLHDAAPVVCEPFSQWVIENRFSSKRPAWEAFGATLVDDVAPFEEMKLRLLYGSHSALAYLGYLGGIEYVDQAIREPPYFRFVKGLMQESRSTLTMPGGVDVDSYCHDLIERFRNPALKHRTWQIAMDGSLKLPQRLLEPVRARLAAGQPCTHLALAIAGWLRYVTGMDEAGGEIDVNDPYAQRLRGIADECRGDHSRYVSAMLQVSEIFGSDLRNNRQFYQALLTSLEMLYRVGARRAADSVSIP